MDYVVYQFEAVGIQEYILASSKLKEMVGSSQLLDTLTGELLTIAFEQIGLVERSLSSMETFSLQPEEIILPRRSGGVFLAVMASGDKANLFQQLWPLLVQQLVPGLRFSVASAVSQSFKQAIKEVRQHLNIEKNTPKIVLPEMTPLAMRSPRTGDAAIKTQNGVSIDFATHVKHQTQEKAKVLFQSVHHKWLPEGVRKTFPTVFNHTQQSTKETVFPFSGNEGDHTIAIIHADGNGIGQYIQNFFKILSEESVNDIQFLKSYATFSQGIEHATQLAAQKAMEWLIKAYENKEGRDAALPIRPLILSGDDVTCIIRADYAFEFMKIFIQTFEKSSKETLNQLQFGRKAFPEYLTMTTGMVFLRSNQPFYMGYQLAEDLCAHSKALARKHRRDKQLTPSTLTFVHVTSTLFDSANAFILGELTTQKGLKLTHEAYNLSQESFNMTPFFALEELCRCFSDDKLNIRFMRKLAATLQLDCAHANQMIKRWKEISDPTQIELLEATLKTYFNLSNLEALCEKNNPISDLITYQSLMAGAPND